MRLILWYLATLSLLFPQDIVVIRRAPPVDTGSSIAWSTYAEAVDDSASSTIVSPSVTVPSGALIVVGIMAATTSIASVSCGGQSLTYIRHATEGSYPTELWYLANSNSGSMTCTGTLNGGAETYRRIMVGVATGIATSSPLDQSSCNVAACDALSSHATNRTAQNVTTTTANQLLVAITSEWVTHTFTAAGGFTKVSGLYDVSMYYRIVSSSGSYPNGNFATVDDASDDQYLSVFATFKGAS